jgi:hypothetical protein
MFVTTWKSDALGTVGSDKLKRITSSAIEPMVKEFANDFLTVNPRGNAMRSRVAPCGD